MSITTRAKGVFTLAAAKKWSNTLRPFSIHDIPLCEACFLVRAGWQESTAPNFTQVRFTPFEFASHILCDFGLGPVVACSDILLANEMFDERQHFASTSHVQVEVQSRGSR